MVGVAVYVLVNVILQPLPPHYSPISDAESNLAVGPYGWIMSINFFGRAILTAFAIIAMLQCGTPGRLRNTGLVLFGLAGICSGLLAFFPTDIPTPGAHSIAASTTSGTIHVVFATSGFILALIGFLLLTGWIRRNPLLRHGYPVAMALVSLAFVGLLSLAATIAFAPQFLGLAERICLAGILGWAFVVCNTIRRLPR